MPEPPTTPSAFRTTWFERDPGGTTTYVAPTTTSPLDQVRDFHRAFGVTIGAPWSAALAAFRIKLITEEHTEVQDATASHDQLKIAQELADLAYVTLGTAVTFGLHPLIRYTHHLAGTAAVSRACRLLTTTLANDDLGATDRAIALVMHYLSGLANTYDIDLDVAITLVHEANMSKLGTDGKPILRSDGKILKGPNYTHPDLTSALLPAQRLPYYRERKPS